MIKYFIEIIRIFLKVPCKICNDCVSNYRKCVNCKRNHYSSSGKCPSKFSKTFKNRKPPKSKKLPNERSKSKPKTNNENSKHAEIIRQKNMQQKQTNCFMLTLIKDKND